MQATTLYLVKIIQEKNLQVRIILSIIVDLIGSLDAMDDCGLRFLIDVQRYIYLSRIVSLPNTQGMAPLKHIITSASYAWAFHSDLQEDLLNMLPSMVKNKPVWSELQLFGVGWWIRNKSLITRLFEKVMRVIGLDSFVVHCHEHVLDLSLEF